MIMKKAGLEMTVTVQAMQPEVATNIEMVPD